MEVRLDADLVTGLVKRGHDVRVRPAADFGGAQVARFADGTLSGATEPRKHGHVATY